MPRTAALLILSSWTFLCPSVDISGQQLVNAANLDGPNLLRSGREWVVLDQSPINGKVYGLATDPHNAGRLYAYGLGFIFRSDDFGETWSSLNQEIQPSQIVVDPSTPDRLYAVFGGIWRSADAGATWSRTAGSPNSVTDLFIDAAGTLYANGLEGALKSTTAGDNWSAVNAPPSGGRLIGADTLIPGVLYALSVEKPTYFITEQAIFKTTDGASSWMGPILRLPAGHPNALRDFRISPTAPITVYVAHSIEHFLVCVGSVVASRDEGETWTRIFSSWAVGPIAPDPIRPNVLYVGTSQCGISADPGGVYQSSTGRLLGQRGFVVQNLAVAPDGSILYALAGGKLAIFRLRSHPTPKTVPFR